MNRRHLLKCLATSLIPGIPHPDHKPEPPSIKNFKVGNNKVLIRSYLLNAKTAKTKMTQAKHLISETIVDMEVTIN